MPYSNWLIKLVYMNKSLEVGAFEAKAHFSELIEAAKGGTELSSPIAGFDAIHASARPGPSVAELKEAGRRCNNDTALRSTASAIGLTLIPV